MRITTLQGTLGANSPKNDDAALIVVTRGIMSRTGQTYGNVDEGFCVQVVAETPRSTTGQRDVLSIERLYASDRWDPSARSRIGAGGAFVDQQPADTEVAAAVERARHLLESGGTAIDGIQIRRVSA